MIILEVFLNGKRLARAGTEDLGVLSTHVTGVGKLGARSRGTEVTPQGYDLDLSIGGLTARHAGKPDEHLRWGPRRKLKIGDEVTIRIIDEISADVPTSEFPQNGKVKKPSDRQRYEFAKTLYFKLRGKFEGRRTRKRSRKVA